MMRRNNIDLRVLIPIGRENAISGSDLAHVAGLTERELRRRISILRAQGPENGSVILSATTAPTGYWLSTDSAEISRWVGGRLRHARYTFRTLKATQQLLRLEERKAEIPENFFDNLPKLN